MNNVDSKQKFTVASLNRQVKGALERNYNNIWLEAEISQATLARSGHFYLKLMDPGKGNAQIDAVMWRGVSSQYGKLIKEGAKILCKGKVTLYEMGGRYQFVVEQVEDSGQGAKALALLELKNRLNSEGVFDLDKKRDLPYFPASVGVITSKTGAAVQDIIKVASRRAPVKIFVAHAAVQGSNAPGEIADAVNWLSKNREIDVLIVGRGGGSSEDLDAFNDEAVVRAVANSPIPVVCAVGHEVDISLAELAADKRAATPSEAAELVVPDRRALAERLGKLKQRLWDNIKLKLGDSKQRQFRAKSELSLHDPRMRLRRQGDALAKYNEYLMRWPSTIKDEKTKINDQYQRLELWSRSATQSGKADLVSASGGLYMWPEPTVASAKGKLGTLVASLDALSPLASLARGYSIVESDQGIIKDSNSISVGDNLKIRLSKGKLTAKVTQKE